MKQESKRRSCMTSLELGLFSKERQRNVMLNLHSLPTVHVFYHLIPGLLKQHSIANKIVMPLQQFGHAVCSMTQMSSATISHPCHQSQWNYAITLL